MGDVLSFRRPEEEPESETVACSRCGHQVDRAAIRCRRCGQSTIPDRPKGRSLPWWIWLGIILAITVVVGWLAGG